MSDFPVSSGDEKKPQDADDPPPGGTRAAEHAVARFVASWWFLPGVGIALVVLLVTATLPPPTSRFTLTVHTRAVTVSTDIDTASLQGRGNDGEVGVPLAPGSRATVAGAFPVLPAAMAPPDLPVSDPAGVVSVDVTEVVLNPETGPSGGQLFRAL